MYEYYIMQVNPFIAGREKNPMNPFEYSEHPHDKYKSKIESVKPMIFKKDAYEIINEDSNHTAYEKEAPEPVILEKVKKIKRKPGEKLLKQIYKQNNKNHMSDKKMYKVIRTKELNDMENEHSINKSVEDLLKNLGLD